MKKKMIEILAPGGSAEAIYAGLYSGADAIYTGTDRFSARAFADNPSVDELCRILDFAHLHGKKIYLTVNTLLTEEELEKHLYGMIKPLYETGLDAVIVQDFGVLDFIREYFPGLSIHASTQMTLLTGEGANQLKPYGVTRIVPARELSIEEIARMRQQTELEIEVFVHGALCYCYSGQCLMSQVIGGRSGNRGMCAQPCRLPYMADGGEKGYFLNPKDLCTLAHVGQLIEAGVDSFKIEGRMKKPAYTALAAHLYRLHADACLAGIPIEDKEVNRDIRRLSDIYNRGGFSGGYLFETSKKTIIDTKKNGHYGVCVGKVTKVNAHTAEYVVTEEVYPQDVVEFRDKNGTSIYEYTLKEGAHVAQRVTARYKKGCQIQTGQYVYRTKNNALLEEIKHMISEGEKNSKQNIKGVFRAEYGQPVQLELYAGGKTCHVRGAVAEYATGKPVTEADIEKRLRKTGESEFVFEALEFHMEDGLFIPLGSIAALRREGFEKIKACILEDFRRETGEMHYGMQSIHVPEQTEEKEKNQYTMIRVTDFGQIMGVKSYEKTNANNVRFYVKLDEFAPESWHELSDRLSGVSYYLSLPAVLRDKNKERFLTYWNQYGMCFVRDGNCAGFIVNSIEALPVLSQMEPAREWEILAGESLYLWNQRTGKVYQKFGIQGSLYMVYGRTTVMTTEGCVNMELGGCQKGKNDGEKKQILIETPRHDEFLVENHCDYCYNMIYEKMPVWHDSQHSFSCEESGWAYIPEIAFTFETAQEVRKVLKQWNFLL